MKVTLIRSYGKDGDVFMKECLQVKMLGGFSIRLGDRVIDDSNNRMKKVWLVLAYLIYCRNAPSAPAGCLALMQSSNEDASDPTGRLKTILYRVRTLLNQLEDSAGHRWIHRTDNSYAWDPEVPLELDVDRFESLCQQADKAEDDRVRLSLLQEALELYTGDFLPKLTTDSWVVPLNAYYHRLYLKAVLKALQLLEQFKQWSAAAELCTRALSIDPYSEELYQHHMHCLISADRQAEAVQVYEQLTEMLFANFGVVPSDESRALFRRASGKTSDAAIPAGLLREQLREDASEKGAFVCEYAFFQMIYRLQARAIVRSGEVIHIALFSVRNSEGKDLSRRSKDTAIANLQKLMTENLRQGDVITRCSSSQLIAMLQQANYEDSCLVCQRILKAFHRQYPHTPAAIHYTVQPLEPLQLK